LPLCPSHHVAAHTPPVGAAALGQVSRLPLLPSHVVDRLGHRDRVTRLPMRSLARPPGELLTSLPGGFVNGLHGVGFPLPCHSSDDGLTCSLGRTFTGWIIASLSGRAHIPPTLVVERVRGSLKASRGEDLQIEEPITCGQSPTLDFHTTVAAMLGSTLIRYQVVEVRQPREKRLLAASWVMKPFHREQLPIDGVVGLIE